MHVCNEKINFYCKIHNLVLNGLSLHLLETVPNFLCATVKWGAPMIRGMSPFGLEGIVRRYHRHGFEIPLARKLWRLPLPHVSQCYRQ